VVDRRERKVGTTDIPSVQAQPLKCLWRGDLVYKVQVDIDERGLTGGMPHNVGVPDFVE
jgi:hypothetical protein